MLNFEDVRTYPIAGRINKFHLCDMISLDHDVEPRDPDIIAVADAIRVAKDKGRKVIVMLGGAVVKEGCSRVIVDLMRRGWVDHVAGNGAVSIHDFEIAMVGETSEDVPNGLADGSFGMAEETGARMNEAIRSSTASDAGYGATVGARIRDDDYPYKDESIAYNALILDIPMTIHIAVGADIIHQHPSCDGAALGAASFRDFHILTESVAGLAGGVLLNIGSAVLMPEVFLKALTIARNLGVDVRDFTTANFDFADMYRPRTRIVEWPKTLGAKGFDIRGNHRGTLPALHRALVGA